MSEEMAQRLADTYQIPLDRAQAALILTQGDVLEAARLLEREDPDRERQVGEWSTAARNVPAQSAAAAQRPTGREVWECVRRALEGMLRRPTANHLEVRYPGGGVVDIPLVAAVLMVLFAFWISAVLTALGWLSGCRFALRGPDIDLPWVDRFFEKAYTVRDQLLGGKRSAGKK